MKHIDNLKLLLILCLAFGLSNGWGQTTFSYTGGPQVYVVPGGVTEIQVEVWGAQGQEETIEDFEESIGGLGGYAIGLLAVTPGEVLNVYVGGAGTDGVGGFNGGGLGGFGTPSTHTGGRAGSGGGASDVRQGGAAFTDRVIVGGGGGGGGRDYANGSCVPCGEGGNGGGGGALTGINGDDVSWSGLLGSFPNVGSGGKGGTPVTGGAAGDGPAGPPGNPGALGIGGLGVDGSQSVASGGGGGGYYGGGSGGGANSGNGVAGGGGAGGSSYIGDVIDALTTPAIRVGNGEVIITILCDALVIDIPVTGVCDGELVTLYAESTTGGVISWDGGVTNGDPFVPGLGTTTYTATSTGPSDCNYTIEISATEIPDVVANSSALAACEGAPILVYGTGAEDYIWTGTGDIDPVDSVSFIAESGTTTYTVIGSVLGCEGPAAEITLEGASQPEVIATATPANVCLGEEFVLTGSGAGAVDFDWGGGITDGDAILLEDVGTFVYILIGASDVGCKDTTMVTVEVYPVPFADGGLDQAQCVGLEVTLNGTGTGVETYEWDPAITDGEPFVVLEGETTYTLTGTNEFGCSDEDEVIVTGVTDPVITAVITDEFASYAGAIDVSVSGGSGSYEYEWSHGPTSQDVTGLTAGTYEVFVSDLGVAIEVCPPADSIFTIMSFVGIQELSGSNLVIYPNPTQDDITISFEGVFTYELTTINGQVLVAGKSVDQEIISLEQFAAGTYFVNVTSNGSLNSTRVVKQ